MADQKTPHVAMLMTNDFTIRRQDDLGDVLIAEVYICGVPHHANFYRVKEAGTGWEAMSSEWDADVDMIQQLSATDGRLMTFKLPDRDGDWICCIWPYNQ